MRAVNPINPFAPELLALAKAIRLLILDVDGVLTDGRLYCDAQGEPIKVFNTLDGHGIKLAQRAGIQVAVISGRDSPALRARLGALGVLRMHLGVHSKLPAAESLLQELQLGWHQVAVVGDDWPDLPLMRRAQLACAPSNAHDQVRAAAQCLSVRRGGEGAVREVCDLLCHAVGAYPRLLEEDAA
jgi:3-deoxy-D-manno-octulosonate 8-phosphate phosphatase (KDO 8-P phosphatase)